MAAAATELVPVVASLRTRDDPPRLAFAYEPRPEDVLLELAIRTAGAVPLPVAGSGGEVAARDFAALDLDRRPPRTARWPETRPLEEPGLAAAVELADRIGPASPRDIWVSAHRLDDPVERLLMTWALLTGAAVVLLPDAGALVPTAAWARPTVFAGDAAEIAALARAAESYRSPFPRRWARWLARRLGRLRPTLAERPPAPPFDRLRAVVLRRTQGLPEPVSAFLRRRGVQILDPPSGLDAAV